MKKNNKTNLADATMLISLAIIVITYWVVIICAIVGSAGVVPLWCAVVYLIFSTIVFGKFVSSEPQGVLRVLAGTLCMGIALILPYMVILNIFH